MDHAPASALTQYSQTSQYIPAPTASVAELKARRFKVDAISFGLVFVSIGCGYIGYQAAPQLVQLLGLLGMIAAAFSSAYLVDTGHVLTKHIRAAQDLELGSVKVS
ncbi:hypothetical protein A7D27_23905 [Pseudomonas sp. 1D4]|uniref:hypothetical protein n=1 Tax=Pseudomonadaceae TaxID=135621 RepID=UPI00084B2F98|nr:MULTISPECIES: hypothetical protein [Pseudomonas]OEC37928.1 hypothetical protein A7D27_23905 [Pseudomonas sp. 1D4]